MAREMEEHEHIELTSDESWDPNNVDWEENEENFTQQFHQAWNAISSIHYAFHSKEQATINDMLSDLPKEWMARYVTRALRMGKHAKDIDYDQL